MNFENEFNELKDSVDNVNKFLKVKTAIDNKKLKNQRLIIICVTIAFIISLVANMFFVNELSQYEKVTETTTTETYDINQNVDGDNSKINNVEGNQYNDNATHNEGSN